MIDVAVVGAGMAGLVCAQQLSRGGYSVTVLEKSRGLGGRVATRRLQETCADHGVRYFEHQGELTQQLIDFLCDRDILKLWTDSSYELSSLGALQPSGDRQPRYAAPEGMTAAAKALAAGLTIRRSQRVTAVQPVAESGWQLTLEAVTGESVPPLAAKALVLAIPAPQALALVEPIAELPTQFLADLGSVEFDPCITAIATYPQQQAIDSNLPWQLVSFADDAVLREVIWDSSKRSDAAYPVFVLHSSAEFAKQQFEAADRQAVGQLLLDRAAAALIPWLDQPTLLQVQGWRYAFVRRSLAVTALSASTPLPLVCGGDWCGGEHVESALRSGQAAAQAIAEMLGGNVCGELRFADCD